VIIPPVEPGGGTPDSSNSSSNSSSSSSNTGVIAGVAAAVVVLGIGGFLFYRRQRGKNHGSPAASAAKREPQSHPEIHQEHTASSSDRNDHVPPLPFASQQHQSRWTNEIVLNPDYQDDISTLEGGTITGYTIPGQVHDDPTVSVSEMRYDYLKNSARDEDAETALSKLSRLSNLGDGGSILEVDDDTVFEAMFAKDILDNVADDTTVTPFVVQVKPGLKLGMMVETSGGIPSVREIRSDSPLAKRVKAGDLLISVNEQDVTTMTAIEVSELIWSQQDSHRTLVFVRPQKPLQFGFNQADV